METVTVKYTLEVTEGDAQTISAALGVLGILPPAAVAGLLATKLEQEGQRFFETLRHKGKIKLDAERMIASGEIEVGRARREW